MLAVQRISIAFSGLMVSGAALACTCTHDTVSNEYAAAKAVFVGRPQVIQQKMITPPGQRFSLSYLEVVFRVERAWKGLEENVAVVVLPEGDGACGYLPDQFEPHTRYLIYGQEVGSVYSFRGIAPGILTTSLHPLATSICTRNAVLDGPLLGVPHGIADFLPPSSAQGDMAALGAGTQPPASGDIDGNGRLDLNDVRLALQAAVGSTVLSTEQGIAADVDEDEQVDVADATLLLRQLLGL